MKYKLSNKLYTPRVAHNVDGWNKILSLFDKHDNKPQDFNSIISVISPNHPTSSPESFIRWHIRLDNLIPTEGLLDDDQKASTHTYAVIAENDESAWDDVTGESYHFPKRYLKLLPEGAKVIYYKGKVTNKLYSKSRLSDAPHYFGRAIVGELTPDPLSDKNDHFCEILAFEQFDDPVLAKNGSDYLEVIPETRAINYWRDGVREIDEETYFRITGTRKSTPLKEKIIPPKLSDEYESNGKEGDKKYRYTAYYERKPKNRSEAIKIHGYSCMGCEFNFEKIYGEHGKNFIHVHHVKPVSEFDEAKIIDPKVDLIVLCPNCHAMVHRNKKHTLSLLELKETLGK